MPGKHLDVYYHGKQVGTLAETPEKIIAFQYTHDWLKEGFSIMRERRGDESRPSFFFEKSSKNGSRG